MTGGAQQNKVYNIPAGENFARVLAGFLLQETKDNPHYLARYKLLLPTRRACRVLSEAFLDISNGKPLILPQMTPLGDVEEEDLSLIMFGRGEDFLKIPPSISPLQRQIILAKLIRKIPTFTQSPEYALVLADELGRLLDKITTEDLSIKDLAGIVPEDFAQHWQITLTFLNILSEAWPQILEEKKLIDVARRRTLLLHALADFWEKTPPDGPVIVAGTTGSIPATANLIRVVAKMPCGRIILPGLDEAMDSVSWDVIEETHPQWGLKKLLQHIDVEKYDVKLLQAAKAENERRALAKEIMRPASTTTAWKEQSDPHNIRSALDGVSYYPCENIDHEAQVIALMMRETLEEKEKIAALITPDRSLAQRVAMILRRWGVEIDDSAGKNLVTTPIGQFLLLLVQAFESEYDPVLFLALLKHPLCLVGTEAPDREKILYALERNILRSRKKPNSLERILELAQENDDVCTQYLLRFMTCIKDMRALSKTSGRQPFLIWLQTHLKCAQDLCALTQEEDGNILWSGDDGQAASTLFSNLFEHAKEMEAVNAAEYLEIIRHFMAKVTLRSPFGSHPRLLLLGQLEARLTSADLIIMGGLNEESWPSAPKHDPWMSRSMRKNFGLPADEKLIGLAAHDFVQAFCAPRVVMTRSLRVGGAPSVPSRWILRLQTVMKSAGLEIDSLTRNHYMEWAHVLDRPINGLQAIKRPAPCPPLSVRPKKLSITKFENWVRDPYGIYAYSILNLRQADDLRVTNLAALKGDILHVTLERFCKKYPAAMPEDSENAFLEIAFEVIEKSDLGAVDKDFMRMKYRRIAPWYVQQETNWRKDAKFMRSEMKGRYILQVDDVAFKIYGIADRIDLCHGGYALIDYKSGGESLYKASQMKAGKLPQLFLEALIAKNGGFDGRGFSSHNDASEDAYAKALPSMDCVYLGYWIIKGAREIGNIEYLNAGIEESAEKVLDGVTGLIRTYNIEGAPYVAVPDSANMPKYNDYEHLARIKEWSALEEFESESYGD